MEHYYRPDDQVNGFTIVSILGEGRYGIAYLAEDPLGHKYVIKQIKKKTNSATRDRLSNEQNILKSLHNSHIPLYVSGYYDGYSEGFIMEYKPGRVFEDLILEDGWQFSRHEIIKITYQLLDILLILHRMGIAHRDIRTPNVILSPNGELVLIDFGLARFTDLSHKDTQEDYWYLGDFIRHLYYTNYHIYHHIDGRPWLKELHLTTSEKHFLKRLLGMEIPYRSIYEIYEDLEELSLLP